MHCSPVREKQRGEEKPRKNSLILVLCTSTHAWVERSRWVLAAPTPLFTLVAGQGLFAGASFDLWSNALNLAMSAEHARESNGAVGRSRSGGDTSVNAVLDALRVLCEDSFDPSWLRSS